MSRDLIQIHGGTEANKPLMGQRELGCTLDSKELSYGGSDGLNVNVSYPEPSSKIHTSTSVFGDVTVVTGGKFWYKQDRFIQFTPNQNVITPNSLSIDGGVRYECKDFNGNDIALEFGTVYLAKLDVTNSVFQLASRSGGGTISTTTPIMNKTLESVGVIPNPNFDTYDYTLADPSQSWAVGSAVGTDVYSVQTGGNQLVFKYDTLLDVWDETLAEAGEPVSNLVEVLNKLYGRPNSDDKLWAYDINTDTWNKSLTSPVGTIAFGAVVGTDIYCRSSGNNTLIKYDTLLDVWDETLSAPSGVFLQITAVGTDVYANNLTAPYGFWKYDTLTDAWDETLATQSIDYDTMAVVGDSIYCYASTGPNMLKYNTILDIWDVTLANATGSFSPAGVVDDIIYLKELSSPYGMWSYDTSENVESFINTTLGVTSSADFVYCSEDVELEKTNGGIQNIPSVYNATNENELLTTDSGTLKSTGSIQKQVVGTISKNTLGFTPI